MHFHQWKLGPLDNFVYFLHDDAGAGLLVDPAWDVDGLLRRVEATGARVTHILATHGHEDHVAGIPDAKAATGATVVAHRSAKHPHDVGVDTGDTLRVGSMRLDFLHTPGHVYDSICTTVDDRYLLTGDTLFIGECGRVDLPGSDIDEMHKTLTQRIPSLPHDLIVCPGHDYGPKPTNTLGEELATNYTLEDRDLDAFRRFMAEP